MAVALATLPLGAVAGEVDACLTGAATGLAGCFAPDDLAAAGGVALATGLTMYGAGACGLAFFAALAGAPLLAAAGLGAAILRLPAVPPFAGLAGDRSAPCLALVLDSGWAAPCFAAALAEGDFEGLGAAFLGAGLLAAAFVGGAFFPVAPFGLVACLAAALAGAVFLFADAATGFLAAAAFPTTGFFTAGIFAAVFFATGFFATGFLAAAFLPAAFTGAAALRATGFFATGLLATVFAAGLDTAVPLPRLVAAATAALLGLPAAFPFCALAAVEPCVVFAISLHRYGPRRPGVIAQVPYTSKLLLEYLRTLPAVGRFPA